MASELIHLCQQSNLGAVIFEDKLPIEDTTMLVATEFNFSPITAALNGGEDYQLLFTVKQSDFEKIDKMADIMPIGYMRQDKKIELVLKNGSTANIKAPGWQKN